ncbi:6106fa20-fb37-4c3d-94b1-453f1d5cc202 [Sclerotinia trifoliorum]|uniref:6106fa20-fb37-4c3d-94b1-453f1d5cc202 n=1 Tax=Sclerotinia trifoliorum TaxID=28548 RepID=A0A8H2VUT9_9HELO|nr:6106fa20-fb37-4c3d-94b1-453f1d5cc202 [Sclerotinia trifoliorum]
MNGYDMFNLLLRLGQLVFSTIVLGITGAHLSRARTESGWTRKRFIYTEVTAALGLFFSLFFLLPHTWNFIHWPIDFLMFAMFMIAFGLLVDFIAPSHCGSVFRWFGRFGDSSCSRWKADVAFAFLASLFFLASFILGTFMHHRSRRTHATATDPHVPVAEQPTNGQPTTERKKWYQTRV